MYILLLFLKSNVLFVNFLKNVSFLRNEQFNDIRQNKIEKRNEYIDPQDREKQQKLENCFVFSLVLVCFSFISRMFLVHLAL